MAANTSASDSTGHSPVDNQPPAASIKALVIEVMQGSAEVSVISDKHDGGQFTVHKDDTLCVDPSSAQYKITTTTGSQTVFRLKNSY